MTVGVGVAAVPAASVTRARAGGAGAPARRTRARSRSTAPRRARRQTPATSARSRPGCCWPTSGSRPPRCAPSRPRRPTTARGGGSTQATPGLPPGAQADAAHGPAHRGDQRDRIGALVAQSYQEGGDLTALHRDGGRRRSRGRARPVRRLPGCLHLAAGRLPAVRRHRLARPGLREPRRATRQGRSRSGSRPRPSRPQQAVACAPTPPSPRRHRSPPRRTSWSPQLAQAQHISVGAGPQRQTALEEIARKRAEERARRAAVAGREARPRQPRPAPARGGAPSAGRGSRGGGRRKAAAPSSGPRRGSGARHAGAAVQPPRPRPAPAPRPPAPAPRRTRPPAAARSTAIAFAKAQLGEPYQWGATGPGSWDCSGLTMGAWAVGRPVTCRTTPSRSTTPARPSRSSELRPGDLVFWSSNGSPSGIHHVAMYLGGGMFIHAPRTGRPVATTTRSTVDPAELLRPGLTPTGATACTAVMTRPGSWKRCGHGRRPMSSTSPR